MSSSSLGSMFVLSQKTGLSTRSGGSANSSANNMNDEEEGGTTIAGINSDPVLLGIKDIFEDSIEKIREDGEARIAYLKRIVRNTKR